MSSDELRITGGTAGVAPAADWDDGSPEWVVEAGRRFLAGLPDDQW